MGGWYGTAAIKVMAIGRPVICSIRSEYLKYIDYGDKIPIIHADPDSIYDVLKKTISLDREKLTKFGVQSRRFVEEIHDLNKITEKLIYYYQTVWTN